MAATDAPQDPVAVALHAGAKLDSVGVLWVTGGSIASSVHGEARATMDVDMVVALRAGQVKPLAAALGRDFYVDAHAMRAAVKNAGGICADLMRHILAEHELLTGEVNIAELRRVLRDRFRASAALINSVEAELRDQVVLPKPSKPSPLPVRAPMIGGCSRQR